MAIGHASAHRFLGRLCPARVRCYLTALPIAKNYNRHFAESRLRFVDDGRPIVRVRPYANGVETNGTAKVEAILTGPNAQEVRIGYSTRAGTAQPGTHFVGKQGFLRFRPGETRHVINIALVDDLVPPGSQWRNFFVDLDVGTAHAPTKTVLVTIIDDD